MKFTTKIIEGKTYISHREIAKTSFVYCADAEDVSIDAMGEEEYSRILGHHVSGIKRDLIAIDKDLPRIGFIIFADKESFFELAQKRNWSESYMEVIRLALKEYAESPETKDLKDVA